MNLDDLKTPALILDRGRVAANTQAMTARIGGLGVKLRPHAKTAKSIDVARLAVAGNFGGITVSTLAEATYFLGHGVTDITYAVCMTPAKLDEAATLVEQGADLKVLTDSPDVARALAGHGGRHQVLIEIDCGEHRTGVAPDSDELLELAILVTDPDQAELAGVLTHGGHSYNCRDPEQMAEVAEDERAAVVLAAERLRGAGHDCGIVSVGSTPTATFARDLTGVTEARPGVYVFQDLFQAGIGVCGRDDIAVTVLATVSAQQPGRGVLYIDAGGLALSKDRSTQALDEDCGFGLVCDVETCQPIPGLQVTGVHQEHGCIEAVAGKIPFDRFSVGTRVRIMPNHACMTAAAYGAYNVIDGGTEVIDTWDRCTGW